jgi:hypothetical protein
MYLLDVKSLALCVSSFSFCRTTLSSKISCWISNWRNLYQTTNLLLYCILSTNNKSCFKKKRVYYTIDESISTLSRVGSRGVRLLGVECSEFACVALFWPKHLRYQFVIPSSDYLRTLQFTTILSNLMHSNKTTIENAIVSGRNSTRSTTLAFAQYEDTSATFMYVAKLMRIK